ncbi:S8 family serine peptidase [Streptomyces sp. NPDC057575]|uniref:S8 family serine peptidase n=1 Tax=unclassified Streptomyces TaxID=2593676 RepID=UPI0036BB423C
MPRRATPSTTPSGSWAGHAGIPLTVHRHYRNVVNGLVVKVPAAQADRLTALPGVASVSKPVVYEAPEKPTPVSEDVLKKAVAQAGGTARSGSGAPSGREIVTTTDLTGVPEAHRQGYTGKSVTVGIVDSGIAYDHPALGGGGFPNAKVLGGYDFADEDADPYDDSDGPAVGHGTHVAGIVAGDDAHIMGAAPDATLRSYRVFGTKNAATEDIIIAALDRAADDGVNVVNMSLGAQGERSSNVLSLAVDNLVASGTPTVVSVGNGYAGPFNATAPAVADGAIAVGSTYSNRYPYLAFTLDDGSTTPVPYQDSGRAPVAPATGSSPITPMASSCDPLPAGSLAGQIALIAPVTDWEQAVDCRPLDLTRTAEAAGAVGAIYHEPSSDPNTIPLEPCCGTTGIPLVAIRESDAQRILDAPDGTKLTWGAYAGSSLNADAAGLMDQSSSWGPGNELEFKPDIAAPGGYILSAMPRALNWYGVNSGTSMAAPHIAGVIALLLQAHPGLTPDQVRTTLQNIATPLAMTGDHNRGLQPVAQQGAGRVDAVAALAQVSGSRPTATPSKLALGDLEGRQQIRHVTVHNPTDRAVTYQVRQSAAVSAAPPYTSEWQPVDAAGDARVHGVDRLTVAAHGSATVTVHIDQPDGVPQGTLFGGWVEFTPVGAAAPEIRVPYLGMAGDFRRGLRDQPHLLRDQHHAGQSGAAPRLLQLRPQRADHSRPHRREHGQRQGMGDAVARLPPARADAPAGPRRARQGGSHAVRRLLGEPQLRCRHRDELLQLGCHPGRRHPRARRHLPAAVRLRQGARRPPAGTRHRELDFPGGHPGPLTAARKVPFDDGRRARCIRRPVGRPYPGIAHSDELRESALTDNAQGPEGGFDAGGSRAHPRPGERLPGADHTAGRHPLRSGGRRSRTEYANRRRTGLAGRPRPGRPAG